MFKVRSLILLLLLVLPTLHATVLKISTEYPDGNSVLDTLREAGERIEERTNERVQLKFYPGGVMGDSVAVLRKVRIGQLQGTFIHSGALASAYKDSQVLVAPLLFRDFAEVDAVRAVFDAELNQGFIDSGWQTFGLVEGGFAYVMTNEPAVDLATLRKQKLWLPANDPFSEKIAIAFNINPITLNIGDVLTALQTGAVNAIVTPPVGAIALQWFTRTQYLTNSPFIYTYGVIALAERALRDISNADRAVIEEEFTRASQELDAIARMENLKAFSTLEKLGISILELAPETRAEVEAEAAAATQKLIASEEFGQAIYDRITALLSDYRQQQ